jgi:hypothetical protein
MEDPGADGNIILRWILFFVPCIVKQLHNVEQQNAHFLNFNLKKCAFCWFTLRN